MKFISTIILLLSAVTGFAVKKEKDLICYIGSEVGSNGVVDFDFQTAAASLRVWHDCCR